MNRSVEKKIFASCEQDEFVGRSAEVERLLNHAKERSFPKGLVLLAAPSVGTSELMRQVYDRLFRDQTDTIPFYFEVKASDRNARHAAVRFLREFLLQTVAFRRNDTKILDASPEICELAQLAVPADGYWIDRLIENCHSDSKLDDDRSFVKNSFSAPMRAAGSGARSFIMIDGLHIAAELDGGKALVEDLQDIFVRSTQPFVFAGLRRYLFAKMPFETMMVDRLSATDAETLIEKLSAKRNVRINDQTRDLIAVQLAGNAPFIEWLFASAAEKGEALDTFERVQKIYTGEIFGGRIGRYFGLIFDGVSPVAEMQARVLRLIAESSKLNDGKVPLEYWKKHLNGTGAELEKVLHALNCREIVNIEPGAVRFDPADSVLKDYVAGMSRLEIYQESRALVIGEILAANVRRAPALMARTYRKHSAIGLRDLLEAFDGRHVSSAYIDYARFKAELKGADNEKIEKSLNEDSSKVALPQIVFVAHTSAFYPKIADIADTERSAIALGFDSDGDEIAVIAAEIDSKLEATREVAEFWCDRLEMAALHCNFEQFKLWLVAPEGFAPDALEVLKERNAYGSSRKQAALLAQALHAKVAPTDHISADEYEIIVPMGEDTEMIAANTIEDIAKRHNFPAKAINQIKTAVVEACINATEHSLSPDRKIYQKFAVDDEKIVVTITNRGLRLADRDAKQAEPNEARRGWGLKLMKGLMDEVRIDQTDDGTSITMTKFIAPIKIA
ncbi:MAG: ATP-binding protein [Pyrinomonadaceae bacterium]